MIGTVRRLSQRLFYSFCKSLSLLVATLFLEAQVYGGARVPRTGSCLFASTHQSFLDPWLVGMCIPRRCCYLARESLFRVPVLGSLIGALGAVPIPRGTAASRGALDVGIRLLKEGEALLVFPEGTRSRDGFLQPLKRGAALLARRTRAPVVPVLVVGTHAVWPRGRRLPRLRFPWLTIPRGFQRRGDGAGRGREAFGETARRAAVRIFFGEAIVFEDAEDLNTFTARLRGAYEELCRHAGVPELYGDARVEAVEKETEETTESKSEAICGGRTERPRSSSSKAADALPMDASALTRMRSPLERSMRCPSPGNRGDALRPELT